MVNPPPLPPPPPPRGEKDSVPIVQESGWAAGPVRMGAERICSTGIRSPDRPARSEPLYRLTCVSRIIRGVVALGQCRPSGEVKNGNSQKTNTECV